MSNVMNVDECLKAPNPDSTAMYSDSIPKGDYYCHLVNLLFISNSESL